MVAGMHILDRVIFIQLLSPIFPMFAPINTNKEKTSIQYKNASYSRLLNNALLNPSASGTAKTYYPGQTRTTKPAKTTKN